MDGQKSAEAIVCAEQRRAEPVMNGESRVISESIRTEVIGKGEPAASAVEAVANFRVA